MKWRQPRLTARGLLLPLVFSAGLTAEELPFRVELNAPIRTFDAGQTVFIDVLVLTRAGHSRALLAYPYFSTTEEPVGPSFRIRIWHRRPNGPWVVIQPSEAHAEMGIAGKEDFFLLRPPYFFGKRIFLADYPFETELKVGRQELKVEVCTWLKSYLRSLPELKARLMQLHGGAEGQDGFIVAEGCATSSSVGVTVRGSERKEKK